MGKIITNHNNKTQETLTLMFKEKLKKLYFKNFFIQVIVKLNDRMEVMDEIEMFCCTFIIIVQCFKKYFTLLRWLRAIKFYYHVKANLLVDRHVKLEPMNGFLPTLLGLELGLGLGLGLGIGL